jgi:hypothetical protein
LQDGPIFQAGEDEAAAARDVADDNGGGDIAVDAAADADNVDPEGAMFEDEDWAEFERVMDDLEAGAAEDMEEVSQPGSYKYIREHLDDQMPGRSEGVTVRQHLFNTWDLLKRRGGLTDTALNDHLACEHNTQSPEIRSLMPRSLYVFKRVLGVRTLEELEYHICHQCEEHAYRPLPKKHWQAPPGARDQADAWPGWADDTLSCPICRQKSVKSARFRSQARPNGNPLVRPYQVCTWGGQHELNAATTSRSCAALHAHVDAFTPHTVCRSAGMLG